MTVKNLWRCIISGVLLIIIYFLVNWVFGIDNITDSLEKAKYVSCVCLVVFFICINMLSINEETKEFCMKLYFEKTLETPISKKESDKKHWLPYWK